MEGKPAVSLSLLRSLENLPQCDDRAFGLGVSELLGEPPSTKKLKLSLRKAPNDRFRKPVTAKERCCPYQHEECNRLGAADFSAME